MKKKINSSVKSYKIRSYCKINLYLRVIKKFRNGYHKINSLITFCKPYDLISISKINNLNDKISFSGKFKNGINKKFNTITKLLNLLRENNLIINQSFKVNIKKNIPHGSGLGGGSSNAANLLNFLNKKMKLKLSKKNMIRLAEQIGFDVPINLEKKNTYITGKKKEILRINNKFKLNLLIVYPNLVCSTKKIYKKNKKYSLSKTQSFFEIQKNRKVINILKHEANDLEKTVIKIYPKIGEIISYIKSQKGCYFSRITGSGSACIGIFSNMHNAIRAQRSIKLKYPKYWSALSKTI